MIYMLVILMMVKYRDDLLELFPQQKSVDKALDLDASIRKDD